MKHPSVRIFSGLLALAMLLSILCIPGFAAQKNTGTRHQVSTQLSSQAVSYYSENGFDYGTYAALGGEISGSCLKAVSSPLYQALRDLMTQTHTYYVNYNGNNGLQEYWPDTDSQAGSSSATLFYSDTTGSFNREHVWPKSRGAFHQQNGGSDLHHLRPTNTKVNSTRSNYTFANVRDMGVSYDSHSYGGKTVLYYNGSYTENSAQEKEDKLGLVEVNDNIKGDVARILLYVYVRWGDKNLFENDPNAKPGAGDSENNGLRVIYDLDTLLQWCQMDPVDTWEMSRNDATQSVQGNRNVFIDYPQFAWLLFGRIPTTVAPEGCDHENIGYILPDPVACTEEGIMPFYQCADCGTMFIDAEATVPVAMKDLILPPRGHSWDGGTVAIEPSTDSYGLILYRCTACGHSKTELLPMLQEEKPCDGGGACPSGAMTDVEGPGHWAHDGIDYALKHGLFKGMSDTTFEPETTMTRAMLVTVLWRYAGQPEAGAAQFGDVSADAWYAKAVAWAAEKSVVNGVGEGRFDPEAPLTREQLATILYRYAAMEGLDSGDRKELDSFPDESQVSSYARQALEWATALALVNGVEEQGTTYLRPQGQATRGQVAVILMRFMDNGK